MFILKDSKPGAPLLLHQNHLMLMLKLLEEPHLEIIH